MSMQLPMAAPVTRAWSDRGATSTNDRSLTILAGASPTQLKGGAGAIAAGAVLYWLAIRNRPHTIAAHTLAGERR